MSFNKSAVAFCLCLATSSTFAQEAMNDLPNGLQEGKFSIDQLDKLEQEKMRLNRIYEFREMQAEIAALERQIKSDSEGDVKTEEENSASGTANGLSAETLLSQNEMLEAALINMQKQLDRYEDPSNPDSMQHHVYVTRTYTVKGVNKARIYYDHYFNTLAEGQEIANGVIIDKIDDIGIVIKKPSGETNRVLKTTQKRAVIESFGIRSQDAQDDANGFVVPSL